MSLAHLLVGLTCIAPTLTWAASVQDIRIASHADHVRIVLDLDGAVTFTPSGTNGFELRGISGGGAVMNAQPKDAPLKRVVLIPDGDKTKLTFETSTAVRAEAFPISASADGGHRFVVDLYKAQLTPASEARAADSSGSTSSAGPIMTSTERGPAVPAVPADQPSATQVVQQPPATQPSYAAVGPSNPPDIGPTPYETADAQPSDSVTTAASTQPMASNAPLNTIPFATSQTAPLQADAASPDDHALHSERALDRGDAKAACAEATEALKATPQDLRALAVLGSCQLALGDAVAARAAFASALAIDPGYHRARIGLAQTDVRQGNIAEARQEYRRVLADNPPTDETYKILDALQALGPVAPLAVTAQGS